MSERVDDASKVVARSVADLQEEFKDKKNLGASHVMLRLLLNRSNVRTVCVGFDLGTGTMVMYVSINGGEPIQVLSDVSVLLLSSEAIPVAAGDMALELHTRLQEDPKFQEYKQLVQPVLIRYAKMTIPRLNAEAVKTNFEDNNDADLAVKHYLPDRMSAERRLMYNSETFAVPVGAQDKEITAVQFMIHVARIFLDTVLPPGMVPRDAIRPTLTLPAGFSTIQGEAYMQMARILGFPNTRVVNEPSAAVVACIPDIVAAMGGAFKNVYVAVLDVGHGTTDVALARLSCTDPASKVITVEMLYAGGDDMLGGATVDKAIVLSIQEVTGNESLVDMVTARRIKESVLRDGVPIRVEGLLIDAEYVGEMVQETVCTMVDCLRHMLLHVRPALDAAMQREAGGPGVAPNTRGLPHAVMLVGGSSNMPCMREEVEEMLDALHDHFALPEATPRPAVMAVTEPQQRVAKGACMIAMSSQGQYAFESCFPAHIGVTYSNRETRKDNLEVLFHAYERVPSVPVRRMATNWMVSGISLRRLTTHVYEGMSLDNMKANKALTLLEDTLDPPVPPHGLAVNMVLELSQRPQGGLVLRSKLVYMINELRWQPDASNTEDVSDEPPGTNPSATDPEVAAWAERHLKHGKHQASYDTWKARMTTLLGTVLDVPDEEGAKMVHVVDKGVVTISGAVTPGYERLLRARDERWRWAHLLVRAQEQGMSADELLLDDFDTSADMVIGGAQPDQARSSKRRRVDEDLQLETLDASDMEADMQRALKAYKEHLRQDPLWVDPVPAAIAAASVHQSWL